MLSRFIATHSRHLRFLSFSFFHPSPSPSLSQTPPSYFSPSFHFPKFLPSTELIPRHFSTHQNGNNNNNNNDDNNQNPTSDYWKISPENDNLDDVFGINDGDLTAITEDTKSKGPEESTERDSGGWSTMAGFKPWSLGEDEKLEEEDVFDIGDVSVNGGNVDVIGEEREVGKIEDNLQLEKEEQALMAVLKGPNRAFGDLIAASGITDAMLDSLIALKNFKDISGLPPLTDIEDERYLKSLRKSSRHEMERQKQEEAAKARVREVDEKGRAYGTGRRKCSIARVWIQPGEGKFSVNDKEFDVYFPMLDHRAALLRPFAETKTLGLWDVKCTVKGGGVSGQVGAIRLGISRALQNWEPGLRPQLRHAGFLTRDPRVVERKKPGKAKARKSFQWVKR